MRIPPFQARLRFLLRLIAYERIAIAMSFSKPVKVGNIRQVAG